MDYTCELIINLDCKEVEHFYKSLLPELENGERDRCEFSVHKLKDKIKINIKAKDSVALRATLNSITALLSVYEKTNKLIEKNG